VMLMAAIVAMPMGIAGTLRRSRPFSSP
jgi:hypothetical protein